MAASQMTMCSSRQALNGGGAALSAHKSSCVCGGARPQCTSLSAWHTCNRHHRRCGFVVRAQDARKGTRLFKKFNKKEEVSEPTEKAEGLGTRLFRFGGAKKAAQEEEPSRVQLPKFGSQLFKNLGKKEGGALVPAKQSTVSPFILPRRQDSKTVFVTGATGRIGARIVQKLLHQGFTVRAGVRDLFSAQQLAEFATLYGVVSREETKRLNAVEFDLKCVESIAKAIGAASKVVLTIGPREDGPKSGVSFDDAANVVEAAKLANVASLVVVYEPGSASGADHDINPLSGLASFFSELFTKPVMVPLSELLNQIADSNLRYTVLKTSFTDGVDDVSPTAQNIDLCRDGAPVSSENSNISKSQVACVVAEVLINPAVAENKVMEVFTSSAAAAIPISELLSTIPVDGRREALAVARAEAAEEERKKVLKKKADADARAAAEEARKASQLAAQLEAEAKKLAAEEAKAASLLERAQAKALEAAASVNSLASKIKGLPGQQLDLGKAAGAKVAGPSLPLPAFSGLSPRSTAAPGKATAAISTARRAPPQNKKPARRAAAASPPPDRSATKPQINSIFGGLFTQETVYVDEA